MTVEQRPSPAPFSLVREEDGHVWGDFAEVEGLFGEPRSGTYELFDWVPETTGAPAPAPAPEWLGSTVWLVPEDGTLDAWRLADVEAVGLRAAAGRLVLLGEDDCDGPPEGHRGPVRIHDGTRWLGSCQEFAAVLPAEPAAPPLVLRGLAPSEELRRALATGTRKALELETAVLELRDAHGAPLTDRRLWASVTAWRPSALGPELLDVEFDGSFVDPVPEFARPLWERWLAGPPTTPGAWAGLDTRRRGAWHDLVRERACRRTHEDRPAGTAYTLDGRHVTDEPSLWLALGEAVNGPGGYFGGCLQALHDCQGGGFGFTAPSTLTWRNSDVARAHLSRALSPDGDPYDLFAVTVHALEEDGMRVVRA
ncbi:barstar family protein [Streptomyces sp. NBC_00572]|uniref:barstar family protein n=1 Tax=Streptomyces sp. NBC_00572 TaxID=2903664 RepID=UPI00225AD898|nr:barstar family protein [Streptomyces sp. NBC_00572]MCX4981428.1 barstar family protein [Streptomyces sp. NBC_00572]